MNLFDNIIKNTAELQILSILLDTSDIKKFYYRGIAHIWNCWPERGIAPVWLN